MLDLKSNLLSLGQLHEKGLMIVISEGSRKIYHKDRGMIMEVVMRGNRLFVLNGKVSSKV